MPNDLLLLLGLLGIAQAAKEGPKLPPGELPGIRPFDRETDLTTRQDLAAYWPDEEDE